MKMMNLFPKSTRAVHDASIPLDYSQGSTLSAPNMPTRVLPKRIEKGDTRQLSAGRKQSETCPSDTATASDNATRGYRLSEKRPARTANEHMPSRFPAGSDESSTRLCFNSSLRLV